VRRSRAPVVAIGGIGEDNAAEVARAGARCVAAIAALCNAADPEQAVARLRAAFEAGAR
jgi:thiamine-phosphate pyrophosphorylase